jgi:hypothetical protein
MLGSVGRHPTPGPAPTAPLVKKRRISTTAAPKETPVSTSTAATVPAATPVRTKRTISAAARKAMGRSSGAEIHGENPLCFQTACDILPGPIMKGLIVKGGTSLFLEGPDPGKKEALALMNLFRARNYRASAFRLMSLSLEHAIRPRPLTCASLAWAYVFVTLSEQDDQRLEPGPFDDELAAIVQSLEPKRTHAATA